VPHGAYRLRLRAGTIPRLARETQPSYYDAMRGTAEGTRSLFIGTYTSEGAEGIYRAEMDLGSGELSAPRLAARTADPSYLAVHPHRPLLFAVGEGSAPDAGGVGSIGAFAVDAAGGGLTFINSQPSAGEGPCHLSCHPGGKWVAAANYGSGTLVVLPVRADGSLGEASCVIRHSGSGKDPGRQAGPHAHAIHFHPDGRHALSPDLGMDRLLVYRFDGSRGVLAPVEHAGWASRPGAGPRALSIHPDGRRVFLVNELDSTLVMLLFDPERGTLRGLDTRPGLPPGWSGESTGADVHVHPSGRFVYCSNRGHDSIAGFLVHAERLTLIGHTSTGGRTPRAFWIDATGRWLIAANQGSGGLMRFRIDQGSGGLEAFGAPVAVPAPVCLQMPQA
jgi:6-phosphogluconolactonase